MKPQAQRAVIFPEEQRLFSAVRLPIAQLYPRQARHTAAHIEEGEQVFAVFVQQSRFPLGGKTGNVEIIVDAVPKNARIGTGSHPNTAGPKIQGYAVPTFAKMEDGQAVAHIQRSEV